MRWEQPRSSAGPGVSQAGVPQLPMRLMISLIPLTHTSDDSDDGLVEFSHSGGGALQENRAEKASQLRQPAGRYAQPR